MIRREFIQFLQYCINERQALPSSARGFDWMLKMDRYERQGVVGIVYGGLQRAGKTLGFMGIRNEQNEVSESQYRQCNCN